MRRPAAGLHPHIDLHRILAADTTHLVFERIHRFALIFLDFVDFNCGICLQDINRFIDNLGDLEAQKILKRKVLVLVRRNEKEITFQERIVNGWRESHRISFPVTLISQDVFEDSQISKTSVVLLGLGGEIEFISEFPLGREKHGQVMRMLSSISN
ncbi:MAG: hypothetical protein V3V40_04000 [Nitrosomonadaceae bacterium]